MNEILVDCMDKGPQDNSKYLKKKHFGISSFHTWSRSWLKMLTYIACIKTNKKWLCWTTIKTRDSLPMFLYITCSTNIYEGQSIYTMIIIFLFCLGIVHSLLSFWLHFLPPRFRKKNIFFVFSYTPVFQIHWSSSKYHVPSQLSWEINFSVLQLSNIQIFSFVTSI